jgi:hypothetical protein
MRRNALSLRRGQRRQLREETTMEWEEEEHPPPRDVVHVVHYRLIGAL